MLQHTVSAVVSARICTASRAIDMRLLNVDILELEEFTGDASTRGTYDFPLYAILSHTWSDQEVSFQQFKNLNEELRLTKGYKKIQACCEQVKQWKLRYLWVDTCCIDKSSSAEFSEAINSMFRWYGDAAVCFAYLEDVETCDTNNQALEAQMKNSRWFTRGWTLQELIAPKRMVFYDRLWAQIGTKVSLEALLQSITDISRSCLSHARDLSSFSIACRISWASARQTTRIEDVAYCLLGIFDVNMPLLYGEAGKAFRRLQEEIIKESDDQSIFAWRLSAADRYHLRRNSDQTVGILAEHPQEFKNSTRIIAVPRMSGSYSITNRGLFIELPLLATSPTERVALLACYDARLKNRVGIPVQEKTNQGKDIFARDSTVDLQMIEMTGEAAVHALNKRAIYLVKEVPGSRVSMPNLYRAFEQ